MSDPTSTSNPLPIKPSDPTLLLSPQILADTSPGPFEGPEKLLEVWFAPSPAELPTSSHRQRVGSGMKFRSSKKAGRSHGNGASAVDGDQVGDQNGEGWTGLRKVRREVWEEMLDVVKCKVLSVIEGEDIDAYLLSESSLFIAPHVIILKTCGTTLNLLGLTRIIDIAREYCGFESVWRCFYSRKSFFFPERQIGPHRGWREEVDFLDAVFHHEGSAYTVGPMNGDHWLLYITSPTEDENPKEEVAVESLGRMSLTNGDIPTLANGNSDESMIPSENATSTTTTLRASIPSTPSSSSSSIHQDQTLEILMTHLSPSARSPFFHPSTLDPSSSDAENRSGHHLGQVLTSHLKIDELFAKEETTIDAFGFEPCGYSANGIVGRGSSCLPVKGEGKEVESQNGEEKRAEARDGGYFTIHVTPEEGWSFASFECNVPLPLESGSGSSSTSGKVVDGTLNVAPRPDLITLIRKVVDIFQPGRLSITLFLSTPPDPTSNSSGTAAPTTAQQLADNPVTRRAWTTFSKDLLGREYTREDRIGYEFDGYDLVFGCFEKKGFKGKKGPDAPAI